MICSGCNKQIKNGEAFPAYNHPEAPPVCFDCLPEEIKKELTRKKCANSELTDS